MRETSPGSTALDCCQRRGEAVVIGPGVSERAIRVIPAYLPPPLAEWRNSEIPVPITELLASREKLVVMSAFHLREDAKGNIYGADCILPLLRELKEGDHSVGLGLLSPRWVRRYRHCKSGWRKKAFRMAFDSSVIPPPGAILVSVLPVYSSDAE